MIRHGDVLHGPRAPVTTRPRKTHLLSLMDDTSRLITRALPRLAATTRSRIDGLLSHDYAAMVAAA